MKNNSSEWRNRSNHVEKQPLCILSPEEEVPSPQSPRSLIRQLAVEVNAGSKNNNALDSSPEEKSSSEPFTDPSLEWDQENFSLKNEANSLNGDKDGGESFEMKKLGTGISASLMEEVVGEGEHDERDKLLARHSFSEDESIDSNSQASDSPAIATRCSQDFSKHLYLGCEGNESPVPYGELNAIVEDENNEYPKRITEEHTPRRLYDSIGDITRGLYDDDVDTSIDLHNGSTLEGLYDDDIGDTLRGLYDDADSIGYTDFDTLSSGPRPPRYISSPTSSSQHKTSGIVTSPIGSSHGSCRSGFSDLPFRGSLTDGPSSPYGEPKGFPFSSNSGNPRDSRENSAGSSKNSARLRGLEKPNSPRNKLKSIFPDFRAPSPYGGSLKEGHSRPERPRKGALRRTLTEFYSPTNSSSSLNEKPTAPSRRRKVSGAIQPPGIFASLVTNVNSPYKDFIPPVRESAITCDCEDPDVTPRKDLLLTLDGEKDCCNFVERKSDSFNTDNSEDKREDFYRDAGDLIAEKQLRRVSGRDSDNQLPENVFPSRSTLTSEASTEKRELRSDPSQKIDDSSIECNSVKELSDCFERSLPTYSTVNRRPSLSGAYSTECIEKEEIPESDEQAQMFRPMRSSFSEPHLSLRIPVLDGIAEHTFSEEELEVDHHSLASQDTNTRNLEDIFKDVCSTKEAIEKLEMILSSSETDIHTDLADTKQTVQKLDKQVFNLNKEVASLGSDVKMVLELLKSLKNGEVVA